MTKMINKIKTFFQDIDKKLTYCEWDEWVKNASINADIEKQCFEDVISKQDRFVIIDCYRRLATDIISILDKSTGIYYKELTIKIASKIVNELSTTSTP